MGNPAISNGSGATIEILDENGAVISPATAADPTLKITDKNGNVTVVASGTSFGLGYDLCPYTVEKLE